MKSIHLSIVCHLFKVGAGSQISPNPNYAFLSVKGGKHVEEESLKVDYSAYDLYLEEEEEEYEFVDIVASTTTIATTSGANNQARANSLPSDVTEDELKNKTLKKKN